MHVLNNEYFGKVMIPLDSKYSLQDDWDQFDHVRLEANGRLPWDYIAINLCISLCLLLNSFHLVSSALAVMF